MKIVLLAGGKGKRLWPASTDEIPKQFLKIYGNDTMIEKTYNDLCSLYDKNDIYIATNREYQKILEKLLPGFDNYIIEPKSRGTYSAVLNIGAYLKYEKNVLDDELICIIPIDSNVEKDFFKIFKDVEKKYNEYPSICLVGIKPNSVSCGYGYIVHDEEKVISFKEKPNYEEALKLINKGALWNSGIFMVRLTKLSSLIEKYNIKDYKEFIYKFLDIPRGSFDIKVLEKEKELFVITSDYEWSDIGVWNNLSSLISESDDYNTNIINYENKKIINDGVKNIILINSGNGIRILNKNNDNFCLKRWGSYEILNNYSGESSIKIKKLNFLPQKNISYQYHNNRNEEWFILNGIGEVIIDGVKKEVKSGDKISIKIGEKHSIRSFTNLEVIEIQYGSVCEEEDIIRLEDDWNIIINKFVNEV